MDEVFGHMVHWKSVYQTVAGVSKFATVDNVNNLLDVTSSQLVQGLSIFTLWEAEENRLFDQFIADRPGLSRLVRRLAKDTGVEISVTWMIFCNYLSYVYHGRPEDLQEVSINEIYMRQFLDKYEHFYAMERMYMLKILHHILNNHDNPADPYQSCFERFICNNSIISIRKSLLNQFHACHVHIRTERINSVNKYTMRCANEIKQICLMMVSSSWGRAHCIQYAAGEMGIEAEPLMQIFLHYIQGFHFRRYGHIDDLIQVLGTPAFLDFHYAHIAAIIVPLAELWNNINLWDKYRATIESIYRENRDDNISPNSVVFMMQWSLLLIRNPMLYDRAVNFLEQHQGHIENALRCGALRILSTFLNSTILHNMEEGHRVRLAVYRLFQELYACVDADDGLYSMPGLVPLLVSLMEDKEIAQSILMIENEVGAVPTLKLNRIINTAEELFPFDFISYSTILHAMMQLESYQSNIFKKLNKLTIFAEERWQGSVRLIVSDYHPLGNDSVIAPTGQQARILWRRNEHVHVYNTANYSYFDILQLLMSKYMQGVRRIGHSVTNDSYSTAILHGLDLMIDVLAYKASFHENQYFAACACHVFNIMRLNLENNQYDHDVVIRCLKVCVKLIEIMPLRVLTFLRGVGVLPTINFDYYAREGVLTLEHLNVNNHLLTIVNGDVENKSSDMVDIIIDLIQYAIDAGNYYNRVQMPMTVFLFEKVFPLFRLSFSQYCRPGYKIRCVAKIVELLHQILIIESTQDNAQNLKRQCFHMLLSHQPLIELFLYAVVQNTNSMIETSLCHRTNWSNVATVEQMRIARICVSTLLLLINETGSCAKLLRWPFGKALVKISVNTVDHIQILASLINNSFEPELRQAACRLLSKFALNPSLKLLAHLQLDSYQVRSLFLEKLRDPTEENNIKVAVIDLIAASVQCQNALTAAFFNFPKYMANSSADLSDNVSSFIIEHLENVDTFPELRTSAIHSSILNLLEKIWSRGIELVMAPLMVMNGFWLNMASSIFEEFTPPNDSYCCVFNIFMNQIYVSGVNKRPNPDEFLSVFSRMFSPMRESWILQLIRYLRNRLLTPDQSDIMLLNSLTQLLVEATEHLPKYFKSIDFQGDIAFQCLEGLWEYMKNPIDTRIVKGWVSVYYHLTVVWTSTCYTNYESDTVNLIIDIINQFTINYKYMQEDIKTKVFTISCKTISYLKNIINEDSTMLQGCLHAVRNLIEISQKTFHLERQNPDQNNDKTIAWTMLIVLTGEVLHLNCDVDYKYWFIGSSFYKCVMETASVHLTQPLSFRTAKFALDILTTYVEKNIHGPVTMEELEQFYRRAYPLKEFLDFRPHDTKTLCERPYEEFWTAYMAMVQYNTALLRKSPRYNFYKCLTFFRMHLEVLGALMKLPSVTVEPSALALVQAILGLGCEMMEHKVAWYRDDLGPKMLDDFYVMVRVCINSCIQIMISPNIIKFYTRNTLAPLNVETVADEIYVQVIEQILEILSTACTCYNKATTSNVDLLCSENIKRKLIGSNVIDADFSIPKISSNLNTKLNYGDLLFLHQILVQILYKVHKNPSTPTLQNQLIIDPTILSAAEEGDDSDSTIELRRKIDKERRLLHHQRKSIHTTTLTGFDRVDLMGLVCPDYVHHGVTDWTTRRVHEPEDSGISALWLAKLSEVRTLRTLEALTTLLGNEIHIHLSTYIPRSLEVLFYRRHFSTELRMFQNYVKKWRCGNVPLSEVLSGITYQYAHRAAAAVAAQHIPLAHRFLIPPRTPSSNIDPAQIFSVESPVPNLFRECRRAEGLVRENVDYFFAPDSKSTPPDEYTAAITNNYLLMLSHWLDYVCNIND